MRIQSRVTGALLAQRGHLIGWVPVCLGVGIGGYFALLHEPDPFALSGAFFAALCLAVLVRRISTAFAPVFLAIALCFAGAGLAQWRSHAVDAPVLGFRYYGAIQGRIIAIDRSASDAVRLTLDRVVLSRMASDRMPTQVRVSVHGDQIMTGFQPGDVVMTTGHLSPPPGPAEPGGYDFRRHAWFDGLGAVGYTRNPMVRWAAPPKGGWQLWVFRQRLALSTAVQAQIPGETGAFAAAIMTGDRSGMGQGTLTDLRAANLAHLLAISGLHMGLLTGFVFAVIRYGLALIPGVALHWPTKKIAALIAMAVGAAYLMLSGGNVATERAFIMVSVMFCAVLLGRRALTLRAVAIAAIIVLVLQPEALTGPGFQMSFAATTALVAVFGALRHVDLPDWPKWAKGMLSVVLSSFVAGLATAPFAAAHFNQIAHYGLIANVLSVPLMGLLVMPAAVLAICLAPFGLWHVGLWLMALGLRWILYVAHSIAGIDGAVGHVIAPGPLVLPLLTIGALWVVLWRGQGRSVGIVGVAVAFFLWAGADRPLLLVADSGALIGIMTDQGRALSKPTGDSFVAGVWLENDGAPVAQDIAGSRSGIIRGLRRVSVQLGSFHILQVSGKTVLAQLDGCDGAAILIVNVPDDATRPCLVFDPRHLRQTGALSIDLTQDGALSITSARDLSGQRPWHPQWRQRDTATRITNIGNNTAAQLTTRRAIESLH